MRKAPSPNPLPSKVTGIDAEVGPISPIVFKALEDIDPRRLTIRSGNPRVHTAKSIEAIARAVSATRVMTPVIVTRDNEVVSGEGRLRMALRYEMRSIPILRAEGLSEEELLAFRIADNAIAGKSHFDDHLLAVALKDLACQDLTFNLEHIGFDQAEIDIRISGLDEAVDPENDPGDIMPDMPAEATSRMGDVWLMGSHRLICGSCLEQETYVKLMAGRKARMSVQDPPYNVSITKHAGSKGAVKHREFLMASSEMPSTTDDAVYLPPHLEVEPGARYAFKPSGHNATARV